MIDQSIRSSTVISSMSGWHMISELELAAMMSDHARLRRLCDQLEAIADALPTMPATSRVRLCCAELREFLPAHHRQEAELLGRLFSGARGSALSALLLDRVRERHLADAGHGEDLAAILEEGDAGRAEPERVGYMLRCFFDSCRSAMAFEELSLLALAGRRLTADATAALVNSLSANRLRGAA